MKDQVTGVPTMRNGAVSDGSSIDWNLDALRLNQNFDEIVGAESVLTSVGVRKPRAQEWFRVNSDPSWRLQTVVLQVKEDGEIYLVAPNLRKDLWEEILPIVLYTVVTRQGEYFLWPVRLPKDGRMDKFIQTDLAAAKEAETKWVRRFWIQEKKGHKIMVAKNLADTPVWPDFAFEELLKLAFQDRYITDLSDPVIKNLRGEI
jgi:hypothetical protein